MQYNSVLLCYQTIQLLHIFSPDSDYFPSFMNIKMLVGQDISNEAPEPEDIQMNTCCTWPYKPGSLDNWTSSLFNVFGECFKKNDEPVPYFFVVDGKNNFEPWNLYRKALLTVVKKYISSHLTKDHQDCVMALFHYHLHQDSVFQGIPFLCSTMLLVVNKQLWKCQQALMDVSDIALYWNIDSIALSDSPVVCPTSDAASEVDSHTWNLQIE